MCDDPKYVVVSDDNWSLATPHISATSAIDHAKSAATATPGDVVRVYQIYASVQVPQPTEPVVTLHDV